MADCVNFLPANVAEKTQSGGTSETKPVFLQIRMPRSVVAPIESTQYRICCALQSLSCIFTFVGAMRNTLNNLHELGMTKERIPNQQLYQNILNRDVYSLNLSTPEISSSVDVIVLVSSHPDDIQLRNAIRSTWANASNSEAIKVHINNTVHLKIGKQAHPRFTVFYFQNTSVSVIFLLGKNTSADLRYEIKRHKDILQVEIEDTYLNLVYKLLSAYRWIHANYPETFVFKIDADVVINLDEIKSLLDEGAKPIIQCHINYLVSPIRNFNSRCTLVDMSSGTFLGMLGRNNICLIIAMEQCISLVP
uniref:Hexosyltransferase n=1 Tax=Heterorhabditis bacteriophora TaxID=37862 RepID=A0A1I7X6M0_HETBA